MMDTIKKIVGQKERRTVRIGTVRGKTGARYQVEDDMGRFFYGWSEQSWPIGARVTMTDDRISGRGPEKTEISIFEV